MAEHLGITALLGPTNTGKTHRAIEEMLAYDSGMIGLPLRLLAREVYDRVTARIGERRVALVTGEEKRVPRAPDYWICTVESMPLDVDVEFLCVDEIQLAAHRQRGHTFTDRLLRARGTRQTWLLGADTMRPMVEELLPTAAIRRHPRLSQLTYSGAHAVAALPVRSAVVAFSVADVYEIAERLRGQHGGTAVVLGALSPRTRNAQVAMFEAGEVQYMVATDAIGMGLNLDLDRVVFASVHKFDGRDIRPLDNDELAQVAGRAGRYTRDGKFGTLRPLPGLEPRTVAAIEHHRFSPVRRVQWRNADLSFDTVDALIESLRERPRRPCLHLVEQADDFDALCQLARQPDVRASTASPAEVELLWDVCRIPDFRKLMLDTHVQMLGEIFAQLTGPTGRVDTDWMAGRIRRLDDTSGDIETLMNRIAFIRTWTYISNHERWIRDAAHWQEVTRVIEDRQSDALHQRLTERFVEDSAPAPPSKPRGGAKPRRTTRVEPRPDPNSPFSELADLDVPGAEPVALAGPRWVDDVVGAGVDAFRIDGDGSIVFGEIKLGHFKRGPDILHPEITISSSLEIGGGAQSRIQRRLVAWSRDAVAALLAPLEALARTDLSASGRGLSYQVERGLGTIDAREARAQLAALTDDDRKAFVNAGVTVGRSSVFIAAALKPAAIRFRAALWAASRDLDDVPTPAAGAVSIRVDRDLTDFYPHVGFIVFGRGAVRSDQLERADAALRELAAQGEPFDPPSQLGAWLGCRRKELAAVLRAMGFSRTNDGRYRIAKRRRSS